MPFPNKGENHYSGIQNEKLITEFLNTNESKIIRPFIENYYKEKHEIICFEHAGGTQRVDDCYIKDKDNQYINGISYKNHKKSGTIDWIKTSKEQFIPEFSLLKEILEAWKQDRKEVVNNKNLFIEKEKKLRSERDSIIFEHIQHFNDTMIKSILRNIYEHYCDHIIITCNNGTKIVYYSKTPENFKEMIGYSDWTYYIKMGRGKNSGQIWRKSDKGEEVNTNLRLRLVLNNGLNAFFGLSSANKTSIPCIQIQQDNVDVMISGLTNVLEENITLGFLQEELLKNQTIFSKQLLDVYKNEEFNDNFQEFNNYISEEYTFGNSTDKKTKELESNYLYLNQMLSIVV